MSTGGFCTESTSTAGTSATVKSVGIWNTFADAAPAAAVPLSACEMVLLNCAGVSSTRRVCFVTSVPRGNVA